ncbi:MAG TPA: ClpXP protease specificity-enhancing factor SspB [Stellaceae bacterium]|nr:ClpXP protease specificity-enhancing factor SspB [Stellaceae bacterium]
MKDLLGYEAMVEAALRGVVRGALAQVAARGLPGSHHFYVTFRTRHPGVSLPDFLKSRYPEEMTITLQYQFWDLEVREEEFSVLLTFQDEPHRLTIPFAAITTFADPAVKFGLQFQVIETKPDTAATPPPAPLGAEQQGQVVALDAFRKK